jgi:hypothetical protein
MKGSVRDSVASAINLFGVYLRTRPAWEQHAVPGARRHVGQFLRACTVDRWRFVGKYSAYRGQTMAVQSYPVRAAVGAAQSRPRSPANRPAGPGVGQAGRKRAAGQP